MQQSKPVPISSPDFKARPTPGLSDAVFLPGQPHEFLKKLYFNYNTQIQYYNN